MHLSAFFGGTTGQIGPSLATGVFDHVSLTGAGPAPPGPATTSETRARTGR